MTKVRMKVHTGYDGKKVVPGDVLEVADFLANRWVEQDIAEIVHEKSLKSTQKSKNVHKKPKARGDT